MIKILLATHNVHKTKEVAAILGTHFSVIDLHARLDLKPAIEDGANFAANASIKALHPPAPPDQWVLADDSGLEVDALSGAPGIYSARYAGPDASDADNREKLLRELKKRGARGRERTARFRCILALARAGEIVATFEGTVEGIIAPSEKGEGGFGYDPLFIPQGYCQTFAQLPAAEKNRLSHRARALEKLIAYFNIRQS